MLGGVLAWLVLVLAWALGPAVLPPQVARSPLHNAVKLRLKGEYWDVEAHTQEWLGHEERA